LDPYKNPRTVRASLGGLHSSQPPPCSDRFKGLCRLLPRAMLPALLAMSVMHPWVWSRLLRMGATAHGPINYGDDFSVRRPRSNAFLCSFCSCLPFLPVPPLTHITLISHLRYATRRRHRLRRRPPPPTSGARTPPLSPPSAASTASRQRFFGDFAALEIMRRALHVCRVGWISAVGSPGRPPRGSGRPRPGQVVVCSCTGAIESMGKAWGEPRNRKASDRSICECVQLVEKTVVRIGSYLGCIVEYRSDLRCFGPPKLISFHVVCFILDYSTNQNHHTAGYRRS
jgi:hypothetical protein